MFITAILGGEVRGSSKDFISSKVEWIFSESVKQKEHRAFEHSLIPKCPTLRHFILIFSVNSLDRQRESHQDRQQNHLLLPEPGQLIISPGGLALLGVDDHHLLDER